MAKNHTHLAWLSLPVQEWKEDNNYKDTEEVVTKLCVVNDPAEQAVRAAGDRISSIRSEQNFQATLLTVDELRRLSSDIKRGTFTKKQLTTVIQKMLYNQT